MAFQGQFTGTGDVEFKLRIDTSAINTALTNVITNAEIAERTIGSAMSMLARFTGDENIKQAANTVVRLISLLNQLQLTSTLIMATNPWLLPLAAISVVGMTASAVDIAGMYT